MDKKVLLKLIFIFLGLSFVVAALSCNKESIEKPSKSLNHKDSLEDTLIATLTHADSIYLYNKSQRYQNNIQSDITNSAQYTTWAGALIGASIIAILSSSYFRPKRLLSRLIYLLFVPAWFSMFYSIYLGTDISTETAYIKSATIHQIYELSGLAKLANSNLYYQIEYFKCGLFFFGAWIVVYLLFWIFSNEFVEPTK
jgi:hypothetical protein